MTPFSFIGKHKEQKAASDNNDNFEKLRAERENLARITEQKIDEIESAITEDYLKHAKAAKEASLLEREEPIAANPANQGDTVFLKPQPLPPIEDDFSPTIFYTSDTHVLLNDDFFD